MNSRKFYFIFSIMVSIFLFMIGSFLLLYVKFFVKADSSNIFSELIRPYMMSQEAVNVLVLGGDKVGRNTDTIMLVNYNSKTSKINILSIPRDTKANVKGSNLPKINSAYPVGGGKLAVDTVSNLLGVKIKYFVYIDTSVFKKAIDLLGGVDINIPVDMNYDDPLQNLHIHLKKGQQHLNGSQAEQFMRFRQPSHYNNEIMQFYDGSDLKRIDAQQNFIKEIVRQKTSIFYITKIKDIINVVFKDMETNINLNEAMQMGYDLGRIKQDSITMFTLPGNTSEEPGGWFFVHDKTQTSNIIKQYFNAKSGFDNTSIKGSDSSKSTGNTKPSSKNDNTTDANKSPAEDALDSEKVKDGATNLSADELIKNNPSNADTNLGENNKDNP